MKLLFEFPPKFLSQKKRETQFFFPVLSLSIYISRLHNNPQFTIWVGETSLKHVLSVTSVCYIQTRNKISFNQFQRERKKERKREWGTAFPMWREASKQWVEPNRGPIVLPPPTTTMADTTTPLSSSSGLVAFSLSSCKSR